MYSSADSTSYGILTWRTLTAAKLAAIFCPNDKDGIDNLTFPDIESLRLYIQAISVTFAILTPKVSFYSKERLVKRRTFDIRGLMNEF